MRLRGELLSPDGAPAGKAKCKLCKENSGGALRIWGHTAKVSGRGVALYEAEERKLRPAVTLLSKVEDKSQGRSEHEAQKRKVYKATASATASPSIPRLPASQTLAPILLSSPSSGADAPILPHFKPDLNSSLIYNTLTHHNAHSPVTGKILLCV